VPLAAGPNTVRNKFAELLHKTVASEATSWSAGAVLPPSAGEAVLRPPRAGSMASGPQSASMAGALQGAAASILITSRKKIPDNIGLVRQCWWLGTGRQAARGTRRADCP